MEAQGRRPSRPVMYPQRSSSVDRGMLSTISEPGPKKISYSSDSEHVGSAAAALKAVASKPRNSQSPVKQVPGARPPRFVLRTVTPTSPRPPEDRADLKTPHIPGSYQTEASAATDYDPVTPVQCFDNDHAVNDELPYVDPAEGVIYSEQPSNLMEAVHSAVTPSPQGTYLSYSNLPLPPIREQSSHSTLRSNSSNRNARHPLFKRSAESLAPALPIEPVLTQVSGNDRANHDISSVNLEVPTGHHQGVLGLASDQVAELLSKLPPLTQDMIDHLQAQYRALSPNASTDIVASNVGNSSPSAYSRQSSIRLKARSASRQPSIGSPSPLEFIHDSQDQENHSASHSEADGRPVEDHKPSSLSKALSDLLEKSLRPNIGLPVTRPTTKPGPHDFESEAVRLQDSPSLPSTNDTNETTDLARLVNQPRLYNKHSYQTPNPIVPLSRAKSPDQRQHWMRQLLGKRSIAAMMQESPTLTARPGYSQKYPAGDAGGRPRAKTSPMFQELDTSVDGTQLHRVHPSESSYSMSPPPVHPTQSESFGKVIVELESLLKEALIIAQHAADKKEHARALEVYVQSPTEATSTTNDSRHQHSTSQIEPKLLFERGTESNIHAVPRTEVSGNISFTGVGGSDQCSSTAVEPQSSISESSQHPKVQAPLARSSSSLTRNGYKAPKKPGAYSPASEHVQQLMVERGMIPQTPDMGYLHSTEDLKDTRGDSIRKPESPSKSPLPITILKEPMHHISSRDWATAHRTKRYPEAIAQPLPRRPISSLLSAKESQIHLQRKERRTSTEIPTKEEVYEFIHIHNQPPIQPRESSMKLRRRSFSEESLYHYHLDCPNSSDDSLGEAYIADFQDEGLRQRNLTRRAVTEGQREYAGRGPRRLPQQDTITSTRSPPSMGHTSERNQDLSPNPREYNLKNKRHFSVRGAQGFSLSRSHRKAPIARDWNTTRKRFVAAIACTSTALMGLIIGIYAGEVPAIQYAIVDENHYSILGNVVFFIGLAIPTLFFWTLPLLHGRKPYTLAALALLLPLQFPQAIAVGTTRTPYVVTYRVVLLLSRALAGFVMGFANINFKTTLLDLFGASLMSGNPHGEMVIGYDVRRHGGGMGVWLGVWTWCSIGSIGVGFTIGALVISGLQVIWGFWITIILTAAVLLLNVITPEVRRSPYRRSMAEVHMGSDVSRRIAKGEVMMHLYATGPKYWWEEAMAGSVLCLRMIMQPGFVVLSFYLAWIYGQVVMVIILLGALTSKYYRLQPQYVGLCVAAIPLGALLAIPFQKASLFSRARHHPPRTDSMTFEKRVSWTSHLVRRVVFMIILPFAGLAYTLASGGSQIPVGVPVVFAGIIGFLSNLAIAECNGIIMETYDTSDLQPGMTGRPRRVIPESLHSKRTNFSCFPRVSAAFAITQTFAFLIAAAATGTGGRVERRLGAQTATAVVASVLLVLTVLLIAVLIRFKVVQVVPSARVGTNVLGGPEDEWKPVVIGNPSGTTRRMSLLELGGLSRWSEIRKRNRLMKN